MQNHTIAAETSVSHPESVNPGESFHIIVSSADIDVPLTQQGIVLLGMVDFVLRLSIPTNVTVDSVSYLPGINTGAGTPSVTNQGTYVQLNVPGPLTPGTVVTLPSIDLELHANGPSGTPIVLTPSAPASRTGTTPSRSTSPGSEQSSTTATSLRHPPSRPSTSTERFKLPQPHGKRTAQRGSDSSGSERGGELNATGPPNLPGTPDVLLPGRGAGCSPTAQRATEETDG